MLDRRRLTRIAQGMALLFAWLFLVLSLAGFDPADPPGSSRWAPALEPVRNPCGPLGATLAWFLLAMVGWASWLLVYAAAIGMLHAIRRHRIVEPPMRLAGLALLVVTSSILLGSVDSWRGDALLPRTPTVGSGGYLGAIGATFLAANTGSVGLLLILACLGGLGLILCHDVLVLWPIREARRMLPLRRTRATAVQGQNHWPVPAHPPGAALAGPLAPASQTALQPYAEPAAAPVWQPSTGPPAVPVQHNSGPLPPATFTRPAGNGTYDPPPMGLLEASVHAPVQEHDSLIQQRAMILEKTLREHGCVVRVVQIDTGPVITMFEIELEAGLRVSRVVGLANDLAIALAVPSVRIVSPIPGKTTVGIEVPNEHRSMVRLGEVMIGAAEDVGRMRIPLFLGKDVKGTPLVFDLSDMPHLLIAGRTGTGKSVCLNAMILSILMTQRPDQVKLILVDPKMVELSQFRRVPHLMHPVVTDMKKAESLLSWACDKMDERYGYLARAGVRNIQTYNALGPQEILNRLNPESEEEFKRIPTYMPYIVIIADELADLMMTAGKEVESHIVRLAQKARAVGMHLILATQKPTVDVITGLIKGNLPARIAFQVSSRGDSRVVLDEMGADRLLGNGDMLFLKPGTSHLVRAQGTYVSDSEVNQICGFLERYPVEFSKEMMQVQVGGRGGNDKASLRDRDELYESAIEIIIREGRGSCSLLQRALGIGYGRAARLIDFMAEDGIVGEYKSGSAREVLYTWEEWETIKSGEPAAESAA